MTRPLPEEIERSRERMSDREKIEMLREAGRSGVIPERWPSPA